MKKLVLSGLAFTFCLAAVAQNTSSSIQSKLSATIVNKTAVLKKPSDANLAPLNSVNPVVTMARNSMVETAIGITTYDLQANYGSTGQRIHLWDDNTISAIWTFANTFSGTPPERGTGYNYFDGTAWGAQPIARVETYRTGFSSFGASDALGEVVVNHGNNTSLGAACSTSTNMISRTTKGTGTWSQAPLSCGSVIWWPRVAIGGANGTTIHALGNDNASGLVNYSRSTDGGVTWANENITLPDFLTDFYEGPVDGYQVVARGDVVAVAMGGFLESLVMWKSTDNGANWIKTIVQDFPLAPYAYDASGSITDVNGDGIVDTVLTTDSGIALAIDNNGLVHLAVGLTRVLDTDTADLSTTTSYFPGTDGLVYWNETLPAGDITGNIIASAEDIDGSGVIEIPDGLAIYQCSLTGMPTLGVDAANNIHLSYSSIIENTTNGNADPLLEEAYRNIYAMNSTDDGATWSTPGRIEPSDFDEQVWPSMAKKVTNKIHLVYFKDGEPGNSYQPSDSPAGTPVPDPWVNVDVIYNDVTNPVGLVENIEALVSVNIYPNPVQSVMNIDYNLEKNQKMTINLVDVLGKTVYTSVLNGTAGVNNFKINVKSFASGIYSLNTVVGNSTYAQKVIIK